MIDCDDYFGGLTREEYEKDTEESLYLLIFFLISTSAIKNQKNRIGQTTFTHNIVDNKHPTDS